MNITRENTGDLTATLKVEVNENDYREKVQVVLKDYRKKANIPGFRAGKVPAGIINKMYGRAVVADEVNKVLSESLQKYIEENKLNVIGQPLPNTEKSEMVDFDNKKEFEFFFDIGLYPEVNLELNEEISVDYHNIKVDKKAIDIYVDDIKKRNGVTINPEESEIGDILKGELVQLDSEGKRIEKSVKKESSISIDLLKDNKIQKEFIKLKKESKVIFNPLKATDNEAETANMLGISKDEKEKMDADYEFTVSEITRIEPAELNEELYKKVFPQEEIKDEDAMRKQIKKMAEISFVPESDKFFMSSAIEKLIEITDISFPNEFVKRWLLESNTDKITKEQIDTQYDSYEKSLKWQLIENKIITENKIKVEDQEIKDFIKNFLSSQMPMPQGGNEADEHLNSIIESVMKNEEEMKKINDQLYDEKLGELFKSKLKLNKKKVTFEEFTKLAQEINK